MHCRRLLITINTCSESLFDFRVTLYWTVLSWMLVNYKGLLPSTWVGGWQHGFCVVIVITVIKIVTVIEIILLNRIPHYYLTIIIFPSLIFLTPIIIPTTTITLPCRPLYLLILWLGVSLKLYILLHRRLRLLWLKHRVYPCLWKMILIDIIIMLIVILCYRLCDCYWLWEIEHYRVVVLGSWNVIVIIVIISVVMLIY